MDDSELDELFRTARAAGPAPSAALEARVLADAAAMRPAPVRSARRDPLPSGGWFARLGEAFGGRSVLAGLAASAAAGLVLGFWGTGLAGFPPASAFAASGTVDLFPDVEVLLAAMEDQG